jgi:competence protein ComEA
VSVWGSFLFRRILSAICFGAVFLFASIVLVSAQAPSAPGKPLPPGPMQAKVKASCTACHNTSRITEQHLSRQQWSAELTKMEGLGAVIPDTDRNALLDYLSKNFGPAKGAAAAKKSAAN